MKKVFLIVFAVTLFVVGIYMGGDRSKWIKTNATVTQATVFEDGSHLHKSHGLFTPFYIDGQMEYTSPRGKHTFKMNNMRYGFRDRKSAEAAAQKLLKTPMPIKYDPDAPSQWVADSGGR